MKYCKNCVHATPPKGKPDPALKVEPHTGWLCDVPGFNMVTGARVSRDAAPCIDMRKGHCGPAGFLFSAKPKR